MPSFVVRIDAKTKEELYSDESETFMGFLFIEALLNILTYDKPGCIVATLAMESLDDDTYSSQFDTSIDYLLDMNQDINEKCGIFLSDEEYGYNSDRHDTLVAKLTMAIESLELVNDFSELYPIKEIFWAPDIVTGFRFTSMHYPDRIAFCVVGEHTEDTDDVLEQMILEYDQNHDNNPDYWLDPIPDPSMLSMQNYLFNQRS